MLGSADRVCLRALGDHGFGGCFGQFVGLVFGASAAQLTVGGFHSQGYFHPNTLGLLCQPAPLQRCQQRPPIKFNLACGRVLAYVIFCDTAVAKSRGGRRSVA